MSQVRRLTCIILAIALVTVGGALVGRRAPAGAGETIPWPPPDLVPYLRLTAPALDKPAVPLPALPLPRLPVALPELPQPKLVTDPGLRPTAPVRPPRALACNPIGSVLGVGSELVECGKARFQRGNLEGASEAFREAVERSGDRAAIQEGRYWLAESLLRLGRRDNVEHHLSVVANEDPRGEIGQYAAHLLGWLALERGDASRALGLFEPLVRSSMRPDLVPYVQHGRALSLYGLNRYPEARDQWTGLLGQGLLPALTREVTFWLGDTLGRLNNPKEAVARLQVFIAAGPSFLVEDGLLSLGWWTRAAGRPLEAIKTYRTLLSAYPRTRGALLARYGLVQAMVDVGDVAGAREEARQVEATDASRTLAVPTFLLVARTAVETKQSVHAEAVLQDLLGRNLEPAVRSYVLLLSGERERQSGLIAEARSRFEALRVGESSGPLGWYAGVRLAQMDLEGRDWSRALSTADALLREPLPPDYRLAALTLAAESAYRLQQDERAVELYSRLASEFPSRGPEAAFSLGWTELRRGRAAEARQAWGRFTREFATHPLAPTALLMNAEAAAAAGGTREAESLLDALIQAFPDREQARLAVLNRAVLMLRAGRASDALRELPRLETDASMSAYRGPIHLTRGGALAAVGRRAEAQTEFRGALTAGEDAIAHLGLGRLAFERQQWEEAAGEFNAARNAGTGPIAMAAEYGLAATAFAQGNRQEFKKLAVPLVSSWPDPATAPFLLMGLSQTAAQDKQWPEARAYADDLVARYPDHRVTPLALASGGAAAARAGQWAVARDMLQVAATRYPTSPAFDEVQLDHAEALVRTGAAEEARRRVEAFVDGRPGDPRAPHALLLLAQAQEASGDRAGALSTYARLRQEHPGAKGSDAVELAQARLLLEAGRWDEARPVLLQAVGASQGEAAAEASFRLGEGYRGSGQYQEATEAYMTAAYVAPESTWARRALVGAAKSFAALKQGQAAVTVYRKLLASANVEPELAEQARQGLRELGVN